MKADVDIRGIALGAIKEMRETGESHEMCARWISERVNAAQSLTPSPPDLVEQVARLIAPSTWRVLDGYLAQTLREFRGQNVGYDPDQFKDTESLGTAREIIAALQSLTPPSPPELVEALERVRDEANTVCGDWRETASLIDSICLAALTKARS